MLFGLRSALVAMVLLAAVLVLIGVSPIPRRASELKSADTTGATPPPSAPSAGMPMLPAGSVSEAEASQEQAQRLMKAVDAILQDAAKNRSEARKLPSDADFMLKPLWAETKEDRERKVRDLLDAVLGVVTDAPVVELQKRIEGLRRNIRDFDDRIVALREKQLMAPKDGMLTSMLSETVGSIGREIEEAKRRVAANRDEIAQTKAGIREALRRNGVELMAE